MRESQRRAKAFLQSYGVLVMQQRRAADEYARAADLAHHIGACAGSSGGGGGSSDKVADAAVAMLEAAEAIKDDLRELSDMRSLRDEVVRRVAADNWLWGEVLQLVCVEGMTGSEAARHLARDRRHPYSPSAVYKLRDRALEKAYGHMLEMGVSGDWKR